MMGAVCNRLQEQSFPENLNGVVEVLLGISTRTGRRNNSCSAESSMSSLPASSLSLSEFTQYTNYIRFFSIIALIIANGLTKNLHP